MRYTEDDVALNHHSNTFDPPAPLGFGSGYNSIPGAFDPGTSASNSFSDFGWKVNLDYTPNDNWLLYATIGTGYKSGGIGTGFGTVPEFSVFDEETLLAVEGGFKSTLWNGRARLNVSAFYYDYEDVQVFDVGPSVFGGRVLFLSNAPQAEYYGAEVEFLVTPLEGLDFMFGLSH